MQPTRPSTVADQIRSHEIGLSSLYASNPLLSMHAKFAFETISKLGEGGMGVVYKVRDKRLGRLAALKMLLEKCHTEDHQRRFLREAKITARLDHPAIPPVHEAGTTADGQLYLLMRLIKGETLSDVLEDYQKRNLIVQRRTELLQTLSKVAEAVAYAHQEDVIHRDLKPENIMVGDFGEVLLMDWGIAKDLSDTQDSDQFLNSSLSDEDLHKAGMTVVGSVIGTPGYMSPEQLEGDEIDGRSDVFALGLILIEILTGEAAVQARSTTELIAITLSGSVTLPRSIDRSVSKELNWIAASAIEVDINQRTDSAEAFVEQLKAYLSGEAVPGYSYSLLERSTRFAKRRPGTLMVGMVSLLFLALLSNLWWSLERERERSRRISVESRLELEKESKKRADAEKLVDRSRAVLAMFNEARTLANKGAPASKITDIVEQALKLSERTQQQLLTAARILGEANIDQGAKDLLEEVVRDYPPAYEALFNLHSLEVKKSGKSFIFTEYLRTITNEAVKRGEENEYVLFIRGVELDAQGKIDEALATYTKIEQYTTKFPWAYNNRGNLHGKLGNRDKAIADYTRAIELQANLAAAYHNRGICYDQIGKLDKALSDYNKAIELDPNRYEYYDGRGLTYSKLGRFDEAIADYTKLLEIDPKFANAYCSRAVLYTKRGEYDKALPDFSNAIKFKPNFPDAYCTRGWLYTHLNRFADALSDFNKAIDLLPNYSDAYCNRGLLYEQMGKYEKAIADYNKAAKINPNQAETYNGRGLAYGKQGNLEAALLDFNKAIELNPQYARALLGRGMVQDARGQSTLALADYDKAIAIIPSFAEAYFNRGVCYDKRNELDKALSDYNNAIKYSPRYALAYYNRGLLHAKQNRAQSIDDLKYFIELAPNYAKMAEIKNYLASLEKKFR